MNNCPFYGHHLAEVDVFSSEADLPFLLIDQRGNQCAIISTAYSPCQMEVAGQTPDWKMCPLLARMRA